MEHPAPSEPPLLSLVIPAFNEAGVIATTIERVRMAVAADRRLRGRTEVIVVSDGSSDATYDESIAALGHELPGMVVELATNVGSHAAIRCGLLHARGEYTLVLSADGQDPPEVATQMLDEFRPGIDLVWGERSSRVADPWLRRTLARVFYAFFRKLTAFDYPPAGFDFVMFTSRVRESLLAFQERNTSIFLLLFNLGFGQTSVTYDRGSREEGVSRWTFRKRAKLAIDMMTGFSAAPIRLVSFVGLVIGIAGLSFGGFTIVRGLLLDLPVSGWASLMVVSSLLGGFTLVAIALIGEYLWRTLDEVRHRPLYLESRRRAVVGAASSHPDVRSASSRPAPTSAPPPDPGAG